MRFEFGGHHEKPAGGLNERRRTRTPSSSSARPAISPTSRSFPPCSGWCATRASTCPSSASPRRAGTLDQLKARAKDSLDQHGGCRPRRLRQARARCCATSTATTTTRTPSRCCKQALGGAKRPLHYLAIPPSLFGVVVEALADGGPARRTRGSWSKSRSATTALRRAALDRILLRALPRGGDLPHRPLPRQGAGAEHRLHPLRQCDARADLEPQLRAQHPDHHGRGVRRAGPRRLLRRDRRDARRGAEPHAAGARQPDDGPADRRGPRGAARPEGDAAEGDAPARRRDDIVRGQYRGYRAVPGVEPDPRSRPSSPSG